MRHRLPLGSSLAALAVLACTELEAAEPVATRALSVGERATAEILAARLRCAACHASESERVAAESAPSLDSIGARRTPASLRKWLDAPHVAKPGTAMPDVLARLDSSERAVAIDELAHFLAARGGPLVPHEEEIEAATLERGRQLFHSVGCVACHTPQESAEDLEQPLWSFPPDERLVPQVAADLGHPAFDTTLDALATFLEDPLAARPSGRMPSLALTSDEARSIAAYLLRAQVPQGELQLLPGLRWRYFEGHFASCERGFGGAEPVAEGVTSDLAKLPEHREDQFGFELSGFVEVEHPGPHVIYSNSDDGSRVYVDGRLVVENDGDHAPAERLGDVWLSKGPHAIVVTFYENAGGEELAVSWKPPGGEKRVIPAELLSHGSARLAPDAEAFELDPRKVARGEERFDELGCGSCHSLEGREALPAAQKPLGELAGSLGRGCLSESSSRAPRFDLADEQRDLLRSLLADSAALAAPRDDSEKLHATLARLDCLACHRREGSGGPNEERVAYFRAAREVDLGNEGRLPPKLDGCGAKLRREWTERVLAEGATARPYLATRMPQFGADNTRELAELFERVDLGASAEREAEFDPLLVDAGRKLAGSKGLGCIQCHLFNGVESLGIPAVDLAHVRERIRERWFERLIADPKSVGMNSRMPELWQEVETASGRVRRSPIADVLDGDPTRQIDALWQYLALGSSMPMPEGLLVPEAEFELVPSKEPELCAVFLRGHTPRGLMVGLPEQVHYAYDLEHSRLVWAWRGRFFNAEGTWRGRAGGLERPPVEGALELEDARAVRVEGVDALPKRLGWKLDTWRRPVFEFELAGVRVEEHIEPVLRPGGAVLRRSVVARRPKSDSNVPVFTAGDGATLEFRLEEGRIVARHAWEVSW